MKPFGFLLCLFLFVGTGAVVYVGHSSKGSISTDPGSIPNVSDTPTSFVRSRKVKDEIDTPSQDQDGMGQVSLEDYRPIDPVPSSKASIRPGPVQHGTPLMPYIPKPSPPPSRPKRGG